MKIPGLTQHSNEIFREIDVDFRKSDTAPRSFTIHVGGATIIKQFGEKDSFQIIDDAGDVAVYPDPLRNIEVFLPVEDLERVPEKMRPYCNPGPILTIKGREYQQDISTKKGYLAIYLTEGHGSTRGLFPKNAVRYLYKQLNMGHFHAHQVEVSQPRLPEFMKDLGYTRHHHVMVKESFDFHLVGNETENGRAICLQERDSDKIELEFPIYVSSYLLRA